MAVRHKIGLDYFPFDIDFFNDEKIEFTSARFGLKGELIAIKLLCKIYRNGFYTEWNEDETTLFAKRAGEGFTPSLVNEIVQELVKRGFFDKSLLLRFNILTSNGIQKRYFEAVERRKLVEVDQSFLLVDVSKYENVNIVNQNVNISPPNADILQQSKVEEKKEEESKPPPLELHAFSDMFEAVWQEWEKFRLEKKDKLTATTKCKQRKKLAKYDEQTAIEMLEQSMTNGWTGIFELKSPPKPKVENQQTLRDQKLEHYKGWKPRLEDYDTQEAYENAISKLNGRHA